MLSDINQDPKNDKKCLNLQLGLFWNVTTARLMIKRDTTSKYKVPFFLFLAREFANRDYDQTCKSPLFLSVMIETGERAKNRLTREKARLTGNSLI